MPLSIWGGVDPATGIVIDVHHPLHGQALEGKVLAIPHGRGSCSGSLGVLECIASGKGPAAIVLAEEDPIIALGALVGQMVFGQSLPVVVAGHRRFDQLANGGAIHISAAASRFKVVNPSQSMIARLRPPEEMEVELTDADRAMLDGTAGKAVKEAMSVVVAMAKLYGARRLIDVNNAHIDACIYVGPASLRFAEYFASLGGRFAVPTTLNSISVDARRWSELGIDDTFGTEASKLAEAYIAMGAQEDSMTCAPYLLPSPPTAGQQIVWAESNAVVYANSVLGARTQKYPDMLDVVVALTGRAPEAGPHISANRAPRIRVDVDDVMYASAASQDDPSFWPLIGYALGTRAGHDIVLVTGLEEAVPRVSDLKSFGAAFATTSSSPMFHIAGITPEASEYTGADYLATLRTVSVGIPELAASWAELNSARDDSVGLIALGNPHLSLDEFEELAQLMSGRQRISTTPVVLTAGRHIVAEAEARGFLAPIKLFGADIITDTCWCMLTAPVVPPAATNIMTNSAKYAHYGAGATDKGMHFGNAKQCVDAACSGIHASIGEMPSWLANEVLVR